MTNRLKAAVGIVSLALIGTPAWAVVVEVPVRSNGLAVVGATIRIGDAEATTGPDGTARLDVPPGEYEVVVSIRNRRVRQRIVVESANGVQIVPPIAVPGGAGSRGWPGNGLIGVGASIGGNRTGDLTVVSEAVTDTRSVTFPTTPGRTGGSSFTDTTTSRFGQDDAEIQEANRHTKQHTISPLTMAWINVPIAAGGFGLLGSRGQNTPAAFGQTSMPDDESGRGWRFYPTAGGGVGRAAAEFASVPPGDSDEVSQTYKGTGPLFGVSVNGVLFPCDACAWYTSFGYNYSRSSNISMTRGPALQSQVDPGVLVQRDDVSYRYRAHVLQAVVGHASPRLALWGGVRGALRRASLEGHVEADYTQAFGIPASQTVTFRNELEKDTVQAVAGADIGLLGSPVFLRLEAATDGTNHSFGAGIGLGLGLGR